MRVDPIVIAAILVAVLTASCRRSGDQLRRQKAGHAWAFVGLPCQPRAMIRVEENAPHTILISEGKFIENSLGETESGDAEIVLQMLTSLDEKRIVRIPKGRSAVIDDSGTVELLNHGEITWNGEILEADPSSPKVDRLLRSMAAESKKQNEAAKPGR